MPIKKNDIVVLKNIDEINFPNGKERRIYLSVLEKNILSYDNGYRVMDKWFVGEYNDRSYQLVITDNYNGVKACSMIWFRETSKDKEMKRNLKIKNLLK